MAKIFGEYDNFALLVFEGTAKIKRPQKKYFDKETEDLLGPGEYAILDSYLIRGRIENIGEVEIRVFHLSTVEGTKPDRLSFTDIASKEEAKSNI